MCGWYQLCILYVLCICNIETKKISIIKALNGAKPLKKIQNSKHQQYISSMLLLFYYLGPLQSDTIVMS